MDQYTRNRLLASYAQAFVNRIQQTFHETGEVDWTLCNKVESLLWPGMPVRDITHAYELELDL